MMVYMPTDHSPGSCESCLVGPAGRAMVQALRSTFDEVEEENEELHVAYAMQQREILTLGHHLEFKCLEQETLIANFERAMAEMDDTMEDICLEALQADAAAYARDVGGDFDVEAQVQQRERTVRTPADVQPVKI